MSLAASHHIGRNCNYLFVLRGGCDKPTALYHFFHLPGLRGERTYVYGVPACVSVSFVPRSLEVCCWLQCSRSCHSFIVRIVLDSKFVVLCHYYWFVVAFAVVFGSVFLAMVFTPNLMLSLQRPLYELYVLLGCGRCGICQVSQTLPPWNLFLQVSLIIPKGTDAVAASTTLWKKCTLQKQCTHQQSGPIVS